MHYDRGSQANNLDHSFTWKYSNGHRRFHASLSRRPKRLEQERDFLIRETNDSIYILRKENWDLFRNRHLRIILPLPPTYSKDFSQFARTNQILTAAVPTQRI